MVVSSVPMEDSGGIAEPFKPLRKIFVQYRNGRPTAFSEKPLDTSGVYTYFLREYAVKEATRLAGRAGGFKSAKNMTPEQRKSRASKAAVAMWKKRKGEP
jgi:hypothetical protein